MKKQRIIISLAGIVAVCFYCVPLFAQVNPDCEMPNVLIVQDRSGSMQGTKWSAATTSVSNIVNTYQSSVRFGLMLFPGSGQSQQGYCSFSGNSCKTDNDCSGWFDYCEIDGSCAQGAIDVQIGNNTASQIVSKLNASSPDGNTPMGDSLKALLGYSALKDAGRRNFVMLITDGQETCSNDPTYPIPQVQALAAQGTKVFVVGFGSGVDASVLNQMAITGGTARQTSPYYYQADDPAGLDQAFKDILLAVTKEVCDGLDNNCNKLVDEDTDEPCSSACGSGVRKCVSGVLLPCSAGEPGQEVCDGQDNDCDGQIDEGVTNACGGCGEVTAEVCDGVDNDCNGQIDDGLGNIAPGGKPLGSECDTGQPGICSVGEYRCVSDIPGSTGAVVCVPKILPEEEVCDGKDNDCDGQIDEDLPGTGDTCLVSDTAVKGPCSKGIMKCNGTGIVCTPSVMPQTEACDYVDNDCDGQVDEGLRNACGLCGETVTEVCDGKDNDCDGKIDDGATCPRANEVCYNGECIRTCPSGECPTNYTCTLVNELGGNYCLSICGSLNCAQGLFCDAKSGTCVDPCEGISCDSGEICSMGVCVPNTCYEFGCPEGEMCRGGTCVGDPCARVSCTNGQYCRVMNDGTPICYSSCSTTSCRADEKCANGQCVADPCFGVTCTGNSVCENGQCATTDNCTGCFEGQLCRNGACLDDPCTSVTCPRGSVCSNGECIPPDTEHPLVCEIEEKPMCCKDGKSARPVCDRGVWKCDGSEWGPCPPDEGGGEESDGGSGGETTDTGSSGGEGEGFLDSGAGDEGGGIGVQDGGTTDLPSQADLLGDQSSSGCGCRVR